MTAAARRAAPLPLGPGRARVVGTLLAGLTLFVSTGFATNGRLPQDTSATSELVSPTVGAAAWLRDFVLPGGELEPAPVTLDTELIVRIAEVRAHGDAFRYDLSFYGLAPGTYDLRDYVRRVDGSTTADLPALPVTIRSVLAPGQVRPHRPLEREPPSVGGYRLLVGLACVAWVAGLVVILRSGKKSDEEAAAAARPQTVADRLQPLVERARAGTLSQAERADLELTLIAFWRERLALGSSGAARALATLREHPEAGPLLRRLEEWLHRPDPPETTDLDVLLQPYRNVAAEALPALGTSSEARV